MLTILALHAVTASPPTGEHAEMDLPPEAKFDVTAAVSAKVYKAYSYKYYTIL